MKTLRPALTHAVQYRGGAYEQMVNSLRQEIATSHTTMIVLTGNSRSYTHTAARDVAKKLGKKLYTLDLSSVSSPYIGETEKNLSALFDRAAASGWILFFDEADALFGKRTNIKNAHDRYANQETSYLLQKIAQYRGIVILKTNCKANFLGRVNKIRKVCVKFPPFG